MKMTANTKLAAAVLCSASALMQLPAQADVVSDWNETATTVLMAATPSLAGVHLAMVHGAIYDAVNAIERRHTVLGVAPAGPTQGASKQAAAASAAYHLLQSLAPGQAAVLDAAYFRSLQLVPDGAAERKGVMVGQQVADGWIELRSNDGRDAVVPYVFGSGPGAYQSTPTAFANPIGTFYLGMKPFMLERASQFRAYGPPDVTSATYAADLRMVQNLGYATSTERTAEETEIARFHTENPNAFWSRNLRAFAATKRLDIGDNARLFALLFTGASDAIQACFDSKYYYNFWRPVTAIHAAGDDGNESTIGDAGWLPLAGTPPHPEYPAAHACFGGYIAETLNRFFGARNLKMTFTSTVPDTVPHVYYRTDDLVEEIIMARVFGGMHYATSGVHGATLGRSVAKWISRHYLRPIRRDR
jgi:hypothetical protein